MPFYQPSRYSPQHHVSLTSLTPEEFMLLFTEFAPLWKAYHRHHDLHGHRRKQAKYTESADISLVGSADKLFFVLVYLKSNPLQSHHGTYFEMTQSKVSQWIKILLPLLEEALSRMRMLALRTAHQLYQTILTLGALVLYLDATERPIPRPEGWEKQKFYYSFKKKGHRIKNLLLVDHSRRVLFLGSTAEGSAHDKALADEVGMRIPPQHLLFVDLGFKGWQTEHPNRFIPYKRPRGGLLTEKQIEYNRQIAQKRVRVENVIADVKRIRIVKDTMRIWANQARDRVMNIAVGLHNLRVNQRTNA